MTDKDEWAKEPDADALQRIGILNDFSERESGYKELVAMGSVLSMVNLGFIYEHRPQDLGGPDFALCEYWYNAAIAAGSAAATYDYGRFFLRQKNYDRARIVFEQGLEREYASSIIRLASLYIYGLGVPKDYGRGMDLLKRASDLGNLYAKRGLASMYINIGPSIFVRLKGIFLKIYSKLEFEIEKKRDPQSERFKR